MEYSDFPTQKIGNIEVADVRGVFPDGPAQYPGRNPSLVDRVIIHHSATNWREVTVDDEIMTMNRIWAYHQNTHGWPGIGYHCLVFPSGRRYITGVVETTRWHTASLQDRNRNGISDANDFGYGLCLVGDFTDLGPSPTQIASTAEFMANLDFGLNKVLSRHFHREYFGTACPGDTWLQWKDLFHYLDSGPDCLSVVSQSYHKMWALLTAIQETSNSPRISNLAEQVKQEIVKGKIALGLQ